MIPVVEHLAHSIMLYGAFDVMYGRDLFWDGQQWHQGARGVFLPNWVFVSDYHGYPEGALFKRV